MYDNLTSNRPGAIFQNSVLEPPFRVERGDEVGLFELGSTVICLFPPGQIELKEFESGKEVRLGQAIGKFLKIRKNNLKN